MTERRIPGLWQLRSGPRLMGLIVLMLVVVPFALIAFRYDRIWTEVGSWRAVHFVLAAAVLAAAVVLIRFRRDAWLAPLLFCAFLLAFTVLGKGWLATLCLVVVPGLAVWYGRRPPPRVRWGKSQWRLIRERFLRSPMAQIGLVGVVGMYMVAFLAPYLAPINPLEIVHASKLRNAAPGTHVTDPIVHTYLLGADQFSRDVLSRIIHGAWISMTIGLFAVSLSASLGLLFGLLAGFFGGMIDFVIMRVVDLMLSIPRLILLLVVMALFKDVPLFAEFRMHVIVVILGLTGWMGTSRLVRGEVLKVKAQDYLQAGRALGLSRFTLIFKHVAPNCLAPVIVSATLGIGGTILVEASLSFLSLGIAPPTPSWGTMIADGRLFLTVAWWIATFPGLAIVFAVMSFNLLGDGLRDAMDPRSLLASSANAPGEDEAEQEAA